MADFVQVQEAELEEIRTLRERRSVPAAEDVTDLSGLCFSGGGIRSATFSLGVLQGLATYGLLRRFDYISSVSGGGFIASWLISWIKHSSFDDVEQELRKSPPEQGVDAIPRPHTYKEAGPINFLRSYSNYLTPRLGLFGADTWVAAASYIRNLLLNLTILISSLAAVLLVPRLGQRAFQAALCSDGWPAAVVAVALLLFSLAFIDLNIADFSLREAVAQEMHGQGPDPRELAAAAQSRVLWLGVLPIFVAAVLGSLSLAQYVKADSGVATAHVGWWVLWGAVGYLLSRAIAQGIAWLLLWDRVQTRGADVRKEFWARERRAAFAMLRWAPLAGLLGGVLLRELARLFRLWSCLDPRAGAALLVSFGPPLVIAIILLNGVLHVGLMSLWFVNQKREWWARLAAWLLIWTLSWIFVFALALYSPLGVLRLTGWVKTKIALIAGWGVSTLSGILGGSSAKTSGEEKSGNTLLELVTTIGPYVFIVGTFVLISYGIYTIVGGSSSMSAQPTPVEMQVSGNVESTAASSTPLQGTFQFSLSTAIAHRQISDNQYWGKWCFCKLLGLFVGLVVVAVVLGWRVDVNEFSLQLFYRNRLVRCYLGASNPQRCPQPFTGFDPTDDTLLRDFSTSRDLKYSGPYPILNCALNISHGERLAWQERKAESFIFTPRFCGYDFKEERKDQAAQEVLSDRQLLAPHQSYRPTETYAYPDGGPYLGTAVATSGAAVNPNMGYHISSPVAFLLTVFNVRLGWWMGNPRREETWRRSTPMFGLFYLLCQLFGVTDDTSKYVNLSDGYHFENLGLYELVRRKCKYIVVCDVGADAGFTREDLGNAVRKCRSDFGVDIELDASPFKPGEDGFSDAHFVAGTIQYPDGQQGQILYIKSAMTGYEPQDILAYKVANPVFPHQSTADQWFDESQFESYRALGRFAVESAPDKLGDPKDVSKMSQAELFEALSL